MLAQLPLSFRIARATGPDDPHIGVRVLEIVFDVAPTEETALDLDELCKGLADSRSIDLRLFYRSSDGTAVVPAFGGA